MYQDFTNLKWDIVKADLENKYYLVTRDPLRVIQINSPDAELQGRLQLLDVDYLRSVLDVDNHIGMVFNAFIVDGDCQDVDDLVDLTGLTVDQVISAVEELVVNDRLLIKKINGQGIQYMDMTPLAYVINYLVKRISVTVFNN